MINQTIQWRDVVSHPSDPDHPYAGGFVIASDGDQSYICQVYVRFCDSFGGEPDDTPIITCYDMFENKIENFTPIVWTPIPLAKEE